MCIFLSSRRRHTRYGRDWSSDVCSSDLVGMGWGTAVIYLGQQDWAAMPNRAPAQDTTARADTTAAQAQQPAARSEERRVGKACRSRWSPYHYKNKHYNQNI